MAGLTWIRISADRWEAESYAITRHVEVVAGVRRVEWTALAKGFTCGLKSLKAAKQCCCDDFATRSRMNADKSSARE